MRPCGPPRAIRRDVTVQRPWPHAVSSSSDAEEYGAGDHDVAGDGGFEQPSLAGEIFPFPGFAVELAAASDAVASR